MFSAFEKNSCLCILYTEKTIIKCLWQQKDVKFTQTALPYTNNMVELYQLRSALELQSRQPSDLAALLESRPWSVDPL